VEVTPKICERSQADLVSGCGDYGILAAVKAALVQVGLAPTRC